MDLVSGELVLQASDIPARKMLSLGRVYHSSALDNNQSLGNFALSLNKQFDPKVDYDTEPLKSARFATAKEACESGWAELAPKVLLGKLEDAQAIYNSDKALCDIYEDSTIKASLLIKESSTQALASEDLKLLRNADGTELLFFKDKEGIWQNATKAPITLQETAEGYTLSLPNDTVEHYNSAGKLVRITNAAQSLTLAYNAQGKLSKLSNSFGQEITLSYDAQTGLLQEVVSYDDTKISYTYDTDHRLSTLTYADGSTQTYHYDSQGQLTEIQDAAGTVTKSYTYEDGKVTALADANGANAKSIAYTKETTTLTQNGNAKEYSFLIQHSQAKVSTIEDDEGIASYTYDANGYPLSHTSKLGVTTLTTYNDRGLLVSQIAKAGTPSEEITLKSYHKDFHKPTKVVQAGIATFYSYNDQGLLTKKTTGSVTPSYKILSAKKLFGYSAKSIATASGIQTKETSFAYNDQGLPSGTTLPNGATNKTEYDQSGNPTGRTSALGFETKSEFDKAGRPTKTTDANGIVTTTKYDSMGRVLESTTEGKTTKYAYDTNGRLTKTTYPDGLETYSRYDSAGNVVESGDNKGAKTLNTYDSNNNLIATESYKEGTLTNKSETVYDSKNRVIATKDSFGNETKTEYNAKGQKSKTIDALGRVTTYEYNALGQLIKETNPDGKATAYTYNTKGKKTEVTTPNGAKFGFEYDALQRTTAKHNPDRGDTTYTYDISDNIATETDANGNTKTYTYDIANRKTGTSYTDASLNETYEYDQGEHAKGKLTKITDASGSLSFAYDVKGNIASKTQTIAGNAFTTAYTYNAQDKLTSQTYPSGKVIGYEYDATGELTTISIDGTPFITEITTNQNGLVSYTYADGTTHSRVYDTNGRVTKLIYPNYTEEVTYNAVSNITQIKADATSRSFDYDLVDRLISYDHNATDYQRFTYDDNGNRLALRGLTSDNNASALLSAGLTPQQGYTYTENSNILTGLKSYYIAEDNTTQVTQETTYTYDATGNIVADGTHTYAYDSRNRLVGVDDNITYQYNYDNKRVSKTVNGITTYFIYDAHKLVGEYDTDGNVITEYLYNGNTPIALIIEEGTQKIYADHLDTPRRVADSTNAIVWSWESKPFGEDEANGSITLNLRFPGQYFDAETKTHYNINRDYNPVTGRYVQSDPIGLDGGVNGYLYANANSLRFSDPTGENPVAIARAVLSAAVKKCAQNKVCKCTAMYAAYKSVCFIDGCKGTDSCATNTFRTVASLMCFTWRTAYIKMNCDKHIPTKVNHPAAAKQAQNKWMNCLKMEAICCKDSFF